MIRQGSASKRGLNKVGVILLIALGLALVGTTLGVAVPAEATHKACLVVPIPWVDLIDDEPPIPPKAARVPSPRGVMPPATVGAARDVAPQDYRVVCIPGQHAKIPGCDDSNPPACGNVIGTPAPTVTPKPIPESPDDPPLPRCSDTVKVLCRP
jgi:hypothetical protein